MRITPEHGDVGIYGANVPFLFLRPSFNNIAKLGDPRELIAVFQSVMGATEPYLSYGLHDVEIPTRDMLQIADAMAVLWACNEVEESDAAQSIGYFGDAGYVPGSMPDLHKIHIARHLLLHGMIGAIEVKPKADAAPMTEFKITQFVALAMAHLGMSQSDAWGLSMTALVEALNAKFPQIMNHKQEGNAPSVQDHDATMEWFDSIRGTQ